MPDARQTKLRTGKTKNVLERVTTMLVTIIYLKPIVRARPDSIMTAPSYVPADSLWSFQQLSPRVATAILTVAVWLRVRKEGSCKELSGF